MDAKWLKNSFIYLLILVAAIALVLSFFSAGGSRQPTQMSLGDVIQLAKQGQIKRIIVQGDTLIVQRTDSQAEARAQTDPNTNIYQILHDAGVPQNQIDKIDVAYQKPAELGNWLGLMVQALPFLFLAGFLLFMMRQAQGSNNQALSFGKSRARMFMGNKPAVTFSDVAGVEEAKQELQEIVEFLKYPEKFAALGARIPHGVLLVGPPGTGKTLLARAVAGEAGVPFFSISGSEFVEMFVGVGASRVRDLFDQAKRNAPCIVFVDEIDAVGRQRGAGLGGSHDEREQTLNQILVEMDGFDSNTNVIVVAATNRPDVLDPALLRPGRFDRQVVLDRPDINGRRAILEVHMRGKPLDAGVSKEVLAKQTAGFSGADLANLVNEAAILAARRNKKKIGMLEFEEAIDRVIAGPERKSRIISEKEKLVTAYHEAGHAVVARMLPNVDPVHKVSIIARGMMGGYTRLLPTEDRYLWSKSQFEDTLAWALGGRVAEELVFGEITTGAENDIERATQTARRMVTEYGMSSRIGPIALGHKEELIFLGREIAEQKNYSEKSAEAIDEEIHRLITTAYERAKEILTTHRDILDRLAQKLMRDETVEGEELERCFTASDEPSLTEAAVAN
ncbi:MAG: ATP-dependent zinc metalloprotease FtsH [Chloroflexi bacterium]|jgi:cell division protease FtsH|nr:ATP-dependent zinc metalloprotease FtsH [Chloroflexota bacterium]HLG50025.1 ATP-dependent zinc metalloprotease FtsH [Chloroflexota bacterium]